MWVIVFCFSAELQSCEMQSSLKQKCKPFIFGKRSKFRADLPYRPLPSKHFDFFFVVFLTLLFWFPIEKKNTKKRLSQEGAKENPGLHPGVTDTSRPEEHEGLSSDPNLPLIVPKAEPQEQESM